MKNKVNIFFHEWLKKLHESIFCSFMNGNKHTLLLIFYKSISLRRKNMFLLFIIN